MHLFDLVLHVTVPINAQHYMANMAVQWFIAITAIVSIVSDHTIHSFSTYQNECPAALHCSTPVESGLLVVEGRKQRHNNRCVAC